MGVVEELNSFEMKGWLWIFMPGSRNGYIVFRLKSRSSSHGQLSKSSSARSMDG